MNDPENVRINRVHKQLWPLLWPSAALIFLASIEVLLKVKDADLFDAWSRSTGAGFEHYLNVHLFSYLLFILYPVAFALYTLWALPRFGVTRYYRLVWLVLGILSLFYTVIRFEWQSVFYYLTISCYFLLLYRLSVFKLEVNSDTDRKER